MTESEQTTIKATPTLIEIPGFEIVRVPGQGSYSVVYEASQQTLQRWTITICIGKLPERMALSYLKKSKEIWSLYAPADADYHSMLADYNRLSNAAKKPANNNSETDTN